MKAWWIMMASLVATPAMASGAYSAVSEANGNISCISNGVATALTSGGRDADPALSPDGHTVAFVRSLELWPDSTDVKVNALWIGDCATGKAHQLLGPRESEEAERRLSLFAGPVFSLQGGFVYVQSEAWVTSGAIHQVNLKTGREKYITDGNSLSVIRTGPYAGFLLTQKHMYHAGGGSYDPTFVVRPDNRWKMMVPGTDSEGETDLTAEWLAKKGWQAW